MSTTKETVTIQISATMKTVNKEWTRDWKYSGGINKRMDIVSEEIIQNGRSEWRMNLWMENMTEELT